MITQKIDRDDDILGVYHEWAREIAKSFDKLSVICLYEGRNELPSGVKVFSLGKNKTGTSPFSQGLIRLWRKLIQRSNARPVPELCPVPSGTGLCDWFGGRAVPVHKLRYLFNFYSYIWKLRKNYDVVFVHMNPVYVILAWPLWKLLRKKIYLWYAHPARNWQVQLAYVLADKILTSVSEAFYAKGGKVIVTGQGIDTGTFRYNPEMGRAKGSILSLGRLSSSKKIDLLIGALSHIKAEGLRAKLSVVGAPPATPNAIEYAKSLESMVEAFGLKDIVRFHGSVSHNETSVWYNKNEIFVNLSPTGYFDKTVLEAMACGCLPLVSNKAYEAVFPEDLHRLLIFRQDDVVDLANKIRGLLMMPHDSRVEIGRRSREIVVEHHSLSTLGHRLAGAFSQK